ncbi:hypothetical protein GN956_G3763 [Arapaima gigas]
MWSGTTRNMQHFHTLTCRRTRTVTVRWGTSAGRVTRRGGGVDSTRQEGWESGDIKQASCPELVLTSGYGADELFLHFEQEYSNKTTHPFSTITDPQPVVKTEH